MEAQRAICTSKWRSGGPFRPQNGGLGGRPKKFRKTVKLSTRVHNLQLEIGVSTRPNVDKTKRAWVANSSQDVRSEGGEPSSNCMSIFLNIQTSIGRRGSAGVAKRLELSHKLTLTALIFVFVLVFGFGFVFVKGIDFRFRIRCSINQWENHL